MAFALIGHLKPSQGYITNLLINNGYIVYDDVNENVNYVIASRNSINKKTQKIENAMSHKIPIIDEYDIKDIIINPKDFHQHFKLRLDQWFNVQQIPLSSLSLKLKPNKTLTNSYQKTQFNNSTNQSKKKISPNVKSITLSMDPVILHDSDTIYGLPPHIDKIVKQNLKNNTAHFDMTVTEWFPMKKSQINVESTSYNYNPSQDTMYITLRKKDNSSFTQHDISTMLYNSDWTDVGPDTWMEGDITIYKGPPLNKKDQEEMNIEYGIGSDEDDDFVLELVADNIRVDPPIFNLIPYDEDDIDSFNDEENY